MRNPVFRTILLALTFFLAFIIPAAAANYQARDLGSLGGGASTSTAIAINNAGQLVGSSKTVSGDQHAFLYSGGVMYDLGTLPGCTSSSAVAINNSGQVIGLSNAATGPARSFLYSEGAMQDLGVCHVTAINAAGQVIGQHSTGAFLYSGGVMQDLGLGGAASFATAINDAGQVVGWASTDTGFWRAFLYSDGAIQNLGTLFPELGADSFANDINNAGQVVGTSGGVPFIYSPSDIYIGGVRYQHNVMYALSLLIQNLPPAVQPRTVYAINDAGQVLGVHENLLSYYDKYKLFLFSNGIIQDLEYLGDTPLINAAGQVLPGLGKPYLYSGGVMQDLNSLVKNLPPGVFIGAYAINDHGWIAAKGSDGHDYLLTPTNGTAQLPGVIRLLLFD